MSTVKYYNLAFEVTRVRQSMNLPDAITSDRTKGLTFKRFQSKLLLSSLFWL